LLGEAKLAVASGEPACVMDGVTVRYSPGLPPAVEGVSFRLGLGEMVLLAGPNGGGKSTILKALIGLVRPESGRVLVLGRDPVRDVGVRRLIGYVPQISELNIHAPLTLWDLVSMGRRPRLGGLFRLSREDEEAVEEAVRLVGLSDKAFLKLSELSGGMLARALIARAFVQDPVMYFLDEPFESIDAQSESIIMELLVREKRRGKLVLIAEHHMGDLGAVDRVIYVNRRIIAQGRPEEVLPRLGVPGMVGG